MGKDANMIDYKHGDILAEDAEALVNTVNCVGIMGRGIALQFKNAFPENFKAYAAACKREDVQPGRMFVYETGQLTNPRYIINFPTKRHWRGKSRMEDIDSGLKALAQEIRDRNIRSIAIPPLGSGLGGLDWAQVRPRMEEALRGFDDLRIIIFEPQGAPEADRMVHNRDVPKMTPGRAALVGLIHRYLGGLLDPFVTLLEIHKLMYFMQIAGEPLRLKYQKGPYGPYAENLRHVLQKIEGHLISGYADGGDAPDKQLELVPGAVQDASAFLTHHRETRARFDRVAELVEGFESPFGLELLATVHWVIQHESAATVNEVVARTYAWSDRKKCFSPRQIALAVDVLSRKSWIDTISVEGRL
jgi:O-acetyl-ADP-ribose deacetylase (regulator of RNase III)